MSTTYAEKLKHPKWQKRRLEILQRDGFKCQLCGDVNTTLHIHHTGYRKVDIWDYKDEELITYCEVCHAVVEYFKDDLRHHDLVLIEKEVSETDKDKVNIFLVSKDGDEFFISILFYSKSCKNVTFVIGMKKATINMMNEIINECSK